MFSFVIFVCLFVSVYHLSAQIKKLEDKFEVESSRERQVRHAQISKISQERARSVSKVRTRVHKVSRKLHDDYSERSKIQ